LNKEENRSLKTARASVKEKTFASNINYQAYTYFALFFQLLVGNLLNFQKNNFLNE